MTNTTHQEGTKFARICSECNSGMNEGYVSEGGHEYYCSDECLKKNYSEEELADLQSEDLDRLDHLYWTQWEEESDAQYILINGVIKDYWGEDMTGTPVFW